MGINSGKPDAENIDSLNSQQNSGKEYKGKKKNQSNQKLDSRMFWMWTFLQSKR